MPDPSLREALATWTRIGLASFGGPAGQISTMHRVLVQEKGWISEARFLHALSFCMLLPGPEAMQLATYVGWLLHGVPGGLAAGLLFVLPGLLGMLALSAVYAAFGGVPLVAGLVFGLKAAVLALVIEALLRVSRRALRSRWLTAIAVAAFLALMLLGVPFPLVVVAAGLLGWAGHRALGERFAPPPPADPADAALVDPPAPSWHAQARTALLWAVAWFAPILILAAAFSPQSVFVDMGMFFSRAAVVTFGGAYAVLAYVAQQAVDVHAWLRPREMTDGLGLAETTPGPLVLVLVYVGFLGGFRRPEGLPPMLGGLLGGLVAAWATFVPCFLWIFLGAPHVERLRRVRGLSAALAGVTAAVVGVIANLAIWFATHSLFREVRHAEAGPLRGDVPVLATIDPAFALLAAAAIVAMLRFRAPMLPVLGACAIAGAAARLAGF